MAAAEQPPAAFNDLSGVTAGLGHCTDHKPLQMFSMPACNMFAPRIFTPPSFLIENLTMQFTDVQMHTGKPSMKSL
jgi:hypothetical protein